MINLKQLLKDRDLSIRECSLFYQIPYTTLYSIVQGKTNIKDCKYETAKKLSQFAGIPMEYLDIKDVPFMIFRNNLQHNLKRVGSYNFHHHICHDKLVSAYMLNDHPIEALYLLSLLEYMEREYQLSISSDAEKYLDSKLPEPFYFGFIEDQKEEDYIPEFVKHNIMEGDLYSVA